MIPSNVVCVNRCISSVIHDIKGKKIVNSKARVETSAIRLFNKEKRETTSLTFKTICLDRLRRSSSRIWIRGGHHKWGLGIGPSSVIHCDGITGEEKKKA